MKTRTGFVSNSSSSSFIVFLKDNELPTEEQMLEQIKNDEKISSIKDTNTERYNAFLTATENLHHRLTMNKQFKDFFYEDKEGNQIEMTNKEVLNIFLNKSLFDIIKEYGMDFYYNFLEFVNEYILFTDDDGNLSDIVNYANKPEDINIIKLSYEDNSWRYYNEYELYEIERSGILLKFFNFNFHDLGRE